jgi:DNA-binding beta-propeller fold protein YncE
VPSFFYFFEKQHVFSKTTNLFKMKVLHHLVGVAVAALLFVACDKNSNGGGTPVPTKTYSEGVLVVNEGPFGGTGTITWHNPETGETEQDIFGRANGGATLGQFVQSLTFHKDLVYVCATGANKVYVLEPSTFEYLDTLEGLQQPRYFLPLDDRYALVSQWGADGNGTTVAKVDLNTRKIVANITCGNGPDHMIFVSENEVWVANSGGFGTDSTISIINPKTNVETSRINLGGKNPGKLAVARVGSNDQIFALCKGSFLDASPTGWLGTSTGGEAVDPYAEDLVAVPGTRTLYFAGGGQVYRSTAAGIEAFVTQSAYGVQVASDGKRVYCADAKDFSSAGEVVIYDENGQRVGSFAAGVAPGEIIVR